MIQHDDIYYTLITECFSGLWHGNKGDPTVLGYLRASQLGSDDSFQLWNYRFFLLFSRSDALVAIVTCLLSVFDSILVVHSNAST